MGRKFDREFDLSYPADRVWSVLPDALAACAFDIRERDDDERTVRAKKKLKNVSTAKVPSISGQRVEASKTWGEKLSVRLTEQGAGSRVWVESRLVFGLHDWGENEKNVQRIYSELIARLAQPAPSRRAE